MVYIILNIVAVFLLILVAKQIDNLKGNSNQYGPLVVSVLMLIIQTVLFTLTLVFQQFWADTMTKLMLKFMFMVESVFLVSLFYALISLGLARRHGLLIFLQIISYIGALFLVYTKFRTFEFSYTGGIFVPGDYLFGPEAREYFRWTWYTVYNTGFRLVLPTVGCLIMLMLREKKATPLQNYQGLLFVEAIVILWALIMFMSYMSGIIPAFSLLYIYGYVIFFILIYLALKKTSVPSGRGLIFSIIKAIVSYLIPAVLLGVMFNLTKPLDKPGFGFFEVTVIACSILAVLFAWKSWELIIRSSRSATNDYEANFEKGLANIDYTGEMDVVTGRMFDVFKNNVECSSMSIFVDDGHGALTPAFSSNNSKFTAKLNSPVFDTLLNINQSVVIYSDIDDNHIYDGIREPLKEMFDSGKFDAMFVLNEGHNIVGVITLGKKISGDHYKEYDKNVFTKLYSYFFVFGYYIRNISNKEVLSTVNREIKMASQIITSIQENIDHIKSNKADVGYLMVPAHSIGGEFIDLIRLTETRYLIVIGDLSGKGIAASMNMVILKSIIRTYLAETHDFKQLVAKINVFIRESLKKGTIFYGLFALLDFETDTMYYINCGIPALYMYTRVYNNVIEIQGSGNVLGFVKDITPYLSVKTTKLNRGDIILACTDGLIDSHSLRGEKFGRERISQALLDNSTYPAQRMAQFTFEGLTKFMSKEMEDDVSIFVMKYKTSAEFASPEEIAAEKAAEEAARKRLEEEREQYMPTEKPEEGEEGEEENSIEAPIVNDESAPEVHIPSADAIAQAFAEAGVDIPEESMPEPDASTEVPDEDEITSGIDIPVDTEIPDESEPSFEAENELADEIEIPVEQSIESESQVDTGSMEIPMEDTPAETESPEVTESSASGDDDFFVEDISAETKKDEPFDFDPSAFGLPDDFTL